MVDLKGRGEERRELGVWGLTIRFSSFSESFIGFAVFALLLGFLDGCCSCGEIIVFVIVHERLLLGFVFFDRRKGLRLGGGFVGWRGVGWGFVGIGRRGCVRV